MNNSFFKTTAATRGSFLPKLLLGLFLLLTLSLALQACGSGGDEEDNQPQPTLATVPPTSTPTPKPASTVNGEGDQPQPTPVAVTPTSTPTPKPPPTVDGEEDQPRPTPVTVTPTFAPTPKPPSTVGGEEAQQQPTPATATPTPKPCPAENAGNVKRADQDINELASDNGNFAFDLYSALSDGEDNLFFSPFSISQVLAMAYAGARGETERQMAETLRYGLPQNKLHPAFNALDCTLRSRGEDPSRSTGPDEEDTRFRLNIANAVWGQEGFEFQGEFLDILAENYGGEMRPLNFVAEPEESRVTINDWVAKETEDKIKNLFPQGTINSQNRLVLTNAIYFNAAWLWPFNPRDTIERSFHLLDGSKVEVPMMTESNHQFFSYAQGDGFQAVEIPYGGFETSMIALLPDEEKFEGFENALSAGILDQVLKELEIRNITLTMPRFEYESAFALKETLAKMGMPDAFSGAADFSGITDVKELWIAAVVHKAFVSVDEKGTEAAAATGVVMLASGTGEEPIVVTLDRPFIFLIRDEPTGTILFLGRVMDPS